MPMMRVWPADAMLATAPSTMPPAYSLRQSRACVEEKSTLSLPPATNTAALATPLERTRGSRCCELAWTATTFNLSVTGCEAKEEQLRVKVPGARQVPA